MPATRMTAADLRRAGVKPPGKVSKYRNQKIVVDGIAFDSKKESRRWFELQALQRQAQVRKLRRQVPIEIKINGKLVAQYVADAVYEEKVKFGWSEVVEDVKSPITRRNPVYRLKRRCLAAMGIAIREV